jgi:hypothetical protein
MSIDNRIETVVNRDNYDIVVRIPHSKMIKENKCTEFRHIIKCQTGADSYDELLNLTYEYLPIRYHYDEHRLLQCICSQSISHVHYIRELKSNEIFRCGADCLKHLNDDLYRRAKQYEKQYQKTKSEYENLRSQYITFLMDYVIFKNKGTTIRELINYSRFQCDKSLGWILEKEIHKKCSFPEIHLFIEYLSETAPEDINIEKFLLSMVIPDEYKQCLCGLDTYVGYSDKSKRTYRKCRNDKKTPTGYTGGCGFYKWGFLNTEILDENPLFIKAEQLSINCKKLDKICKVIRNYHKRCHA